MDDDALLYRRAILPHPVEGWGLTPINSIQWLTLHRVYLDASKSQ